MTIHVFLFLSFTLVLLGGGCRSGRSSATDGGVEQPLEPVTNSVEVPAISRDIPPSAESEVARQPVGIRLRPGLSVNVQVLVNGVKEVDEKSRRISDAGNIMLPLVGNVPVANRTVMETQKLLESLYGRFFVRPQIIIESQIESGDVFVSPWGYVTVLGRVKNPGRVNIPPTQDLTVSRAIQLAGGLSTSARGSSILITRASGGESVQMRVNLDRIGLGDHAKNDLELVSGDVVFVPETIF